MPHIVRARGRPLFAALLLLAGARAGTAQAIAGRVIDAESRLPTRLLAVHVLGDSNHVVVSTRTDTAGIFYALLPTGGRFRVRFALDSTTTFDSDTIRVPGDEFVQREFVVRLPRAFFEFEVEKQVRQAPGVRAPRYPSAMTMTNTQGEVLAQFVVDSAGLPRLETFRVLRATNAAFVEAVRAWLPTARFIPAELGGRHVAQMVQQPFTFSLTGDSAVSPFPPPTPQPPYPPLPRSPPR